MIVIVSKIESNCSSVEYEKFLNCNNSHVILKQRTSESASRRAHTMTIRARALSILDKLDDADIGGDLWRRK